MNYEQTLSWLFSQLPMYQTQGASAYKKDLTNTLLLSKYLHHPEKDLVCIHVAGTNGKGSTSHLLASVFQEAGYKVGLYTSPHLKDFRERIKINGKEIEKEYITAFVEKHKTFFESNHLSFFEMTVGLAFEYFKNKKTDIAIIEVGMGGRLDSTNIITPELAVITNIGLDHTQFLGNTLEQIALEKAGIIKPNVPVVVGEYTQETKKVFEKIALKNNAPIYFASDVQFEVDYSCPLLGDYQIKNKKTVRKALQIIQHKNRFNISEKHIEQGFLNVIKNTGLQGRWQQLGNQPSIVCDTAHNAHGLEIVMNQVKKQKYNHLHLVLGFVNDKNLEDIITFFPENAHYYFCKPNIPRGLDEKILAQKFAQHNRFGNVYNSVSDAYIASKKNANPDDFIYIGGSTFVVAEIL